MERIEYTGRVMNGVVILESGASLPEGTLVTVAPVKKARQSKRRKAKAASRLGEMLMEFAGAAQGLPTDMAENHDHYLHGLPKKK